MSAIQPKGRTSKLGRTLAGVGVLLALALLVLGPTSMRPASSPTPAAALAVDGSTVDAQLSIHLGTVVDSAGSAYLGVDMYPQKSLGSTQTNQLASTNIHYIRWPSGHLNDAYDITTNTIHGDGGGTSHPMTDGAKFVAWCEKVGCHAVLGVPGEINDPSFAAHEVRYVEGTLHFHPAYWEIGNEPALWHHWNKPWSEWTSGQDIAATPSEFASMVHNYAKAIHGVDPNAKIIGLPGTGKGAYGETTWIYDVMHDSGSAIAALAIHVYPAGHLGAVDGTLSDFDKTLSDASSLTARMPGDWAAVRKACSSCHVEFFATEMNAASTGYLANAGNYGTFMETFPEVPYVAALMAQGLKTGMHDLQLFELQSAYQGGMYNQYGNPRPVAQLYKGILQHLLPDAVKTSVSGSVGEFFAVALKGSTHVQILLVNANPYTSVHLGLSSSGLPTGSGTIWKYDSGMSKPSSGSWYGSSGVTLSAESVTLIQVN